MKRTAKKIWLNESQAAGLTPDPSFAAIRQLEATNSDMRSMEKFVVPSEPSLTSDAAVQSANTRPGAPALAMPSTGVLSSSALFIGGAVKNDFADDASMDLAGVHAGTFTQGNGNDFSTRDVGADRFDGNDGLGTLNWANATNVVVAVGEHTVAKRFVADSPDAISPQEQSGIVPVPVVISTALTFPSVIETTDAADNTSTIYQLQVGQTAQGTLGFVGDRDWYAVDLAADQVYSFALTGTGVDNVIDPYLRLMDPSGLIELQFDDDSLPGNNSVFTFTPTSSGTYYIAAGAFNDFGIGQYGVAVSAGARPSFDTQMGGGVIDADFAWTTTPGIGTSVTYAFRQSPATYTAGDSDISTFTQLTATEIAAVRLALQAWSEVSGITFVEVNPGGYSDNATMLFANYTDTDDGAGAFAYYPGSRADTAQPGDVWLNTNSIPTNSAINFGSYAYNAIMHEIGHAIGLSHPGTYNAAPDVSITYANNAQFTQDSHQYSVMSYFDESNTGAQFVGYAETPMLFDVYSAQQIYGTNLTTRAGDTIYGFNSNAGAVYDFSTNVNAAFAIWDVGGSDTLDASGYVTNQTINLNEGVFSSIGTLSSNIVIALGVVIENATGGSGADTLTGNSANNRLQGNDGVDNLLGNDGDDTLFGGAGADTINGGAGTADTAAYDSSASAVSLDLQTGVYAGGDAAGDVLSGIENLSGSAFNDSLTGNSADNVLIGNNGNDLFRLFFGGNDTVSGGNNDDSFLFGGAFTAADGVDGGAGSDVVNLAGNYAAGVTFTATTMTNIEALYLTAGNIYRLSLVDANVGAGQTLLVAGSGLAVGNVLTFDGTAETDGRLDVQGGAGNDDLKSGAGNDDLSAGGGVNVLAGNAGNDLFRLYFGGTDTASGGANDDSFLFGGSFTAADSIDGGTGSDTINLAGNYAAGITFAAATMTNVEALYLTAGNSYNLTLVDANVAAAQILLVAGSGLVAGNVLTFDGSTETNGRLDVQGGAGNDNLTAGAGNDDLSAGSGINILAGNAGNDLFRLYFGGTDTASGGANDDSFLFGGSLTAADNVDGGTGYDVVNLGGNYAAGLTFAATTIANVEALFLTAGNSYNLTLADANVAAGQILLVAGAGLAAGNILTFNGSAETNGRFTIQGGAGNDNLTAGVGNDDLSAGGGINVLAGNAGNDLFRLYFGGTDTASGGDNDDSFLFGASLTAADSVNGGAGYDVVNLGGNYAAGLTFAATTITNVEALYLTAGNSYNLILADANVAAGQTLLVAGSDLIVGNVLTFNGSAETNGSFDIRGGAAADVLMGGAGNDTLVGNGGADILGGAAGADRFSYVAVGQSTGVTFDTINGFNSNIEDSFDFTSSVTGIDPTVASGSLSLASFDIDLASSIGAAQLAAQHAVLFAPTAGTLAEQMFLVVDANGIAGYQAGADFVFNLASSADLINLGIEDFV